MTRRGSYVFGARLERVLDESAYDLTLFKVHFGALTLKLYDKGARVLRVEAIVHNVRALRCGRSVEKLSTMLAKLQRMAIDFLNVVQAAHCSFFDAGALDSLSESTHRGSRRLAAWDARPKRSIPSTCTTSTCNASCTAPSRP